MTSVSIDRRFGLNGGIAIKAPCKAATTANISLNGAQTVNGIALVTGDRCLVNDQSNSIDNGIYTVDSGNWVRSPDCDGSYDLVEGSFVKVNQGTNNGFWYLTTTGTIVVGTTGLTFERASSVLAAVSVYMQTVLVAANEIAARLALGIELASKGGLLTGRGSSVVGEKAVGQNGQILIADSSQVDGLRWADASEILTPPIFQLDLDDLGAGAVNTTPQIAGGSATATFTRASVATTYGSNGLLISVLSGVARSYYEPNSLVYGGYLSEVTATQLVTPTASIRDMTDASWVKSNVTAAKTATGWDGVINSATRLTCTSNGGTVLQTLTAAASQRTYSVGIRRVTGTGTIKLVQNATKSADLSALLNTSTYTLQLVIANVLNSAFGIEFGTSGDVIEVDYHQFEAGQKATSRIITAGATRAADKLTYAATGNIGNTQGAAVFEYMGHVNPGTDYALSDTVANKQIYTVLSFTTAWAVDPSVNTTTVTTPAVVANSVRKAATTWTGSVMSVSSGGVRAVGVFSGSWAFSGLVVGGYGSSAGALNSAMKNLKIYPIAFAVNTYPPLAAGAKANLVVFDGNSLTDSATSTYPAGVATLLGTSTIDFSNVGLAGADTNGLITTEAVKVLALYSPFRSRNVLVFWEGTNSIANGQTDSQAYSSLRTYVDAARAKGFKVIVLTVIARTSFTAGMNVYKDAYNATVRANWTSFAEGFVDVAADGRFTNSANLTYYNADGTHLTATGYAAIASLVAPAVFALL